MKGYSMSLLETHLKITPLTSVQVDMTNARPCGTLQTERGEIAFLGNDDYAYENVTILEFLPLIPFRGNHYHLHKREALYLIEGELIGYFWDPETPSIRKQEPLKKGTLIEIQPGLAHAFEPLMRSLLVELSPDPFDKNDCEYVTNPFTEKTALAS